MPGGHELVARKWIRVVPGPWHSGW
jgi:hypothetical protein